MSISVMTKVWESGLPKDDKFVSLSLADWANDDGENIYPSIDRIVWKTGYSKRKVQYVLKKLRDEGILEITGHTNSGVNIYKLNIERLPKREPYNNKGGAQNAPQDSDRGAQNAPLGCTDCTESIKEPSVNLTSINARAGKNGDIESPLSYEHSQELSDEEVLEGDIDESYDPSAEALKRLEKTVARSIVNQSDSRFDLSGWPEDVRPVVEVVCELWNTPPPKKLDKKGGDYARWIEEAREILFMCGNTYNINAVDLVRVYRKDYEQYMNTHKGVAPFTVTGVPSLVKALRAKIGLLVEEASSLTANVTVHVPSDMLFQPDDVPDGKDFMPVSEEDFFTLEQDEQRG